MKRRLGTDRAFTLVELMIAVAIMALLTGMTLPTYQRYLRRARTTEALINLKAIFDSVVSYHDSEHASSAGVVLPRQFPAAYGAWAPPLGNCCAQGGKCVPSSWKGYWLDPRWQAMNFSQDDPFYYSYMTTSSGPGNAVGHVYYLQASGDLNCNGVYSYFLRTAMVTTGLSVASSSGVYTALDTE